MRVFVRMKRVAALEKVRSVLSTDGRTCMHSNMLATNNIKRLWAVVKVHEHTPNFRTETQMRLVR